MSLEVNSTASTFTTSSSPSSSSSSGVRPIPVYDQESRFCSLHDIVAKCLSSLETINPDDYENPNELEETKKLVCENFTTLYLSHVESLCKSFKKEVDSCGELSSLSRDGYLDSINHVKQKRVDLEDEIEDLVTIFNEDLEIIQIGFTKKAAKSFKTRVLTGIGSQIQGLKTHCSERVDKLVEKALMDFYNSNLDSYPNLHPELSGASNRGTPPYHYSQDIVDFLNKNDKLNDEYKEVLFECSIKLKEAHWYETTRNKSYKKTVKHSMADHAKTMEFQVRNLKVGESCLFLGGTAVHAVIYEVIRKSQDCFEFTIINTGDDEKNAKNRKPKGLSGLFLCANQYCHKSYLVASGVLNSDFLETLLEATEKFIPMEDVLDAIDDHLKASQAQPQLGRLRQSQERGSCPAKSSASWFKGELIRKLGVEKGTALYLQFKHFKAERNYEAILKLENQVHRAHFQSAYGERIYKKQKSRYEKKELIKKTLASEAKLKQCLKDFHNTATQVIYTWGEKAKKAEANL